MTIDNRAAFTLEGGTTGVLLLHGFVGTPGELRGLGDRLHAEGHTVHAPLLAGHGGSPDDLMGVPWQAWQRSAERGFDLLAGRCERVVVVGQSLGGALGTLVAQRRVPVGLVTMGTPLRLHTWLANLLPFARRVMPWWYPFGIAKLDDPLVQKQMREFAPDADLTDPTTRKALARQIRLPMGAVDEARALLRYARKNTPFVAVPTLILHGRRDETAHPSDAELLYGLIGSADKRLVWFEQSGHLLTIDTEADAVCKTITRFISEITSS
jgi:carboxylesterase